MIKIVEYFINKPKVVNLTLIFILITGIISVIKTKKERIQSDADYGVVYITTIYPGASPKDVELKVTSKLEKELKSIDGINDLESLSMEDFSTIEIELDEKSNYEKTKREIRKVIENVDDLPDEIKGNPVISELSESIRPMFEISIIGEADYSLKRKYALALEKNLMASKNVSKVEKYGFLKREVKIKINQENLNKFYVSIGEIIDAIKTRNFRMSAGDLLEEDAEKKYVVYSEFDNVNELNDVIIRSGFTGNRVVISDVAKVIDDFEKTETMVRYNGNEAINMVVYKKSEADMFKLKKDINKIINNFRTTLPDNIHTEIIVDHTEDVQSLLTIVMMNALIGFGLVLIVLFILLNNKVAFWTAMGIPASIFLAFTLFPFFNVNIHYFSLVAMIIVLGMLVDDAIIISENIYRLQENGMKGKDAALTGLREVIWPVLATVVTTIVAFLPILGMTGTLKKIFFHIPVVVTLLLICSLLEAIFFLPSHMAHVKINIKKKVNYKINFFKNFENLYEKVIIGCLKHKFKTIFIFVLILLLSFFILSKMKFLFFDLDDSLRCFIEYELPKGSTLNATSKKIKEVESILSKLSKEEVKSFVTVIGEDRSEAANYGEIILQGNYFANTIIHLTPREDRKRTAKQIITQVKKEIKKINGFTKIEADIVTEGPPVGKAVNISFVSNDDKARYEIAEDLKNFLKKQKGVTNIEDNVDIGKKQIAINFDYDLLSRNGLDPLRIADTIRVAFNGIVATDIKWEGEEVDFRVILDESSRSLDNTVKELTVQKVQTLTVQNKKGNLIPIGKFIKLDERDDILRINHIFGDRAITVFADIDTKENTPVDVNKEINKIYSKKILKYPGMQMKIGGEADEINKSMDNFKIAVVLALIGIYFILVILFNSFLQPLLVLVAIPFSFAGVIYTFFIHGMAITMPVLIGFLGLMGVVVNDSLVMISFINKSRDKNKLISIDSLAKAAKNRLRPIVLTTITTAAALFPLAYGFGGYNMFASPMVMAIAWGLIFATLVTLILIPSMYLSLSGFHLFLRSKFKKK